MTRKRDEDPEETPRCPCCGPLAPARPAFDRAVVCAYLRGVAAGMRGDVDGSSLCGKHEEIAGLLIFLNRPGALQ